MNLLVVEDEVLIRHGIVRHLVQDGHTIQTAGSAEVALELDTQGSFEGYILDVVLPQKSGLELCRILRENGRRAPILVLTALSSAEARVSGLDSGADDYITKPFDPLELRARVRSMERRIMGYPLPELELAGGRFNPDTRMFRAGDYSAKLTPKESALLKLLHQRQGESVTREAILAAVWNRPKDPPSNTLDVLVHGLRDKLSPSGAATAIQTVWGSGFRLVPPTLDRSLRIR